MCSLHQPRVPHLLISVVGVKVNGQLQSRCATYLASFFVLDMSNVDVYHVETDNNQFTWHEIYCTEHF